MRFQVPQFIDIEDKIFGPLSWWQFIYVGGGVGMAVVMFITLPLIVFLVIGLPLGILAGALAFYPINNRPFSFFLEAVFNYLSNQQLYLWQKKDQQTYKQKTDVTRSGPVPTNTSRTRRKKNISSLSRKLELQALQKTE